MIDAKRLPGWRARLAETLVTDPTKRFAWGTHDCFLGLIVPAVIALIGEDVGVPYRGKYETEAGAKAVLKGIGFADLAEAFAAHFPEIPVAQAHIGDIAAIPTEIEGDIFGVGLGVVTGERITVLTPNGSATVKLLRATRAFRIG